MKKKYYIIFLIFLIGLYSNIQAQSNMISFERNDKIVYVSIPFQLTEFSVEADQSLVLTPFIQVGDKMQVLPTVVLNGDRQNKIGNGSNAQAPYVFQKMSNRSNITYKQEVAYEAWMSNASLKLLKTLFDASGTPVYTIPESLSNMLIHKGSTLPNSLSTTGQTTSTIPASAVNAATPQPVTTPINTAVPATQYPQQTATGEDPAMAEFRRIHSSGAIPLTQHYATNDQYSPSTTPVQTQSTGKNSDIAPPEGPISATELFGNRTQQQAQQVITDPSMSAEERAMAVFQGANAPVTSYSSGATISNTQPYTPSYAATSSISTGSAQPYYTSAIPQPYAEGATYTSGNTSTTIYEMYFPGKKVINITDNSANMPVLENLFKKLNEINVDNTQSLISINIIAFTSVDDAYYDNEKLVQSQANAFKNYLQHHYRFPENYYRLSWVSEDWDGLTQMINQDQNVPNRYEVQNIINTIDVFNGRELKIMQLNSGTPYEYIKNRMFPYSRKIRCEIVYTKQ
ncbi:MAG: DUF3868 domain-containing protein [Prevotella sp.]|jgi:hypothetical protein|nr:DUF3868 domain-containing protein [Prevotella sp.]